MATAQTHPLHVWRVRRGITVSELCRRAQISRQAYYLILRGTSEPRLSTLERISEVLKCAPEVLAHHRPKQPA